MFWFIFIHHCLWYYNQWNLHYHLIIELRYLQPWHWCSFVAGIRSKLSQCPSTSLGSARKCTRAHLKMAADPPGFHQEPSANRRSGLERPEPSWPLSSSAHLRWVHWRHSESVTSSCENMNMNFTCFQWFINDANHCWMIQTVWFILLKTMLIDDWC